MVASGVDGVGAVYLVNDVAVCILSGRAACGRAGI